MEYQVGDKVKIIGVQDDLEDAVGLVGEISSVWKQRVCVVLEKDKWESKPYLSSRVSWWYTPDKIEPYCPVQLIDDYSQLKVGDVIRLVSLADEKEADNRLKRGLGHIGKVVTEYSRTGNGIGVEFENDIGGHCCNNRKNKDGHCLFLYDKNNDDSNWKYFGGTLEIISGSTLKSQPKQSTKKPKETIDVEELLSLIEKGFKYIAKDSDNTMFIYKTKPKMDIGGKQWYVEGYTDCKQFGGFSVKKKKLDFYWGLPVALADIVADIEKYLV